MGFVVLGPPISRSSLLHLPSLTSFPGEVKLQKLLGSLFLAEPVLLFCPIFRNVVFVLGPSSISTSAPSQSKIIPLREEATRFLGFFFKNFYGFNSIFPFSENCFSVTLSQRAVISVRKAPLLLFRLSL